MRTKLLVSDRMASLGTLAAGIAHEINNPLAYVAGNLEAMAESLSFAKRSEGAADCDELSAVVNDARDGAERVRKIVLGLRSFSRSEREQRVPLALADVLESAIRLTGNELRHRAQLVRELGPVPLVVADDGRLTQVFINLLVNAAHAIPEGHSDDNRITVRTRTDPRGRAVIEVEDTGKGMPPEVQARVFDPFFTTKDVGEGTGLGLSICHGIISGLGGQISIDSAPGHGTIVRVVLPPQLEPAQALPTVQVVDAGPA
jgi:signal transduction histidine kinase